MYKIIIFTFFLIKYIDLLLIKLTTNVGRWFKLHFIINMIVCYLSYDDVVDIIEHPYKGKYNSNNIYSLWIVTMLHIYHMVFFKLTYIDYIHHIFSVFVCVPFAYNLHIKLLSLHYFIGSGFPGAIDYFLLILVKYNIISSLLEKNLNAWINIFIRIPGGVIASYITYLNREISDYSIIFMIVSFINVTFFGKLAIENHIERKLRRL